jgi:hypothetical protein
MDGMGHHFGHGQRGDGAALLIPHFNAGVVQRQLVVEMVADHIAGRRLGFVQRLFQMAIFGALLVGKDALGIMQVNEIAGHIAKTRPRPNCSQQGTFNKKRAGSLRRRPSRKRPRALAAPVNPYS